MCVCVNSMSGQLPERVIDFQQNLDDSLNTKKKKKKKIPHSAFLGTEIDPSSIVTSGLLVRNKNLCSSLTF